MQRLQPLMYTDQTKNLIYFTSKLKGDAKQSRDYLLSYDITNSVVKRLVGFKLPVNSILVPNSSSPQGFVVLSLNERSRCLVGSGHGVGIRFISSSDRQTQPRLNVRSVLKPGMFGLTYLNGLPAIADLTMRNVIAIDLLSFQKRRLGGFPKDHLPLYLDSQKRVLVSLQLEGKDSFLLRTIGGKMSSKVRIAAGYRVVQMHNRFVFVKQNLGENSLTVLEAKGWADVKSSKHKLNLPPAYPVDKAYYHLDVVEKVAVAYLKAPNRNRRWDKAFVVDYRNNRPIAQIPIPKGLYVSGVAHLSGQLFLILKSYSSKAIAAIRSFDLKQGAWRALHYKVI